MDTDNTGEAPETLRRLREASGLTLNEIVERALAHDPNFPQSVTGYYELESRGTADYWRLRALAKVFGRTHDQMAVICYPPQREPVAA